ncbi:cytochrome P450 [Trametes polyzona]|nr:cytochrome P450 [Trametes polyzona]
MTITGQDITVLCGLTTLLYISWYLYRLWTFVFGTPLRNLPGPPVSSWVHGNQPDIGAVDNTMLPDIWFSWYGKNFVDRGFYMRPRLWTLDTRAIQHVLTHPDDFPKPEQDNKQLEMFLGKGEAILRCYNRFCCNPCTPGGILTAYGDEHKYLRRLLNPAFGPAQIRGMTNIFIEKSAQLRDIWQNQVKRGSAKLDVNEYLSRMTLDVIGLAGFGRDFNALDPEGKPNEFLDAFHRLFTIVPSASSRLPFAKLFRDRNAETSSYAAQVFQDIGAKLVAERRAAILETSSWKDAQNIERKDLQSRDVLTLLLKANMAQDIPDDQRLSDQEVINQIPTFLTAGHETTSSSSTWALYLLSCYPATQKKLREELFSVDTESPTMDELLSLSYLDGVVRETLRLHSAVGMMTREAARDTIIPLREPFEDINGRIQHEIRIAKGDEVVVPILSVHRSKAIWGDDALDFKPERWQQPPEAATAIPGVWGHLLAFTGGPRACIGYRFALVELKAILFVLVRAFAFELAVPAEEVVAKTHPTHRPSLKSEPQRGAQMPLIVTPYEGT